MSLLSLTKKILQKDKEKKPVQKKAASSAKKDKPKAGNMSVAAGEIGLNLLVSEKAMGQQQKGNIVVFRVRPDASKKKIAAAVTDKFKVNVLKVNTIQFKPKTRRRGATVGKTNHFKKAYVTVDDISKVNVAP